MARLPVLTRLLQKPTGKTSWNSWRIHHSASIPLWWASLFWKKMLNRTDIAPEERALLAPKPLKGRFTILQCVNTVLIWKWISTGVPLPDLSCIQGTECEQDQTAHQWRANVKTWVRGSCSWNDCMSCSHPPLRNIFLKSNYLKGAFSWWTVAWHPASLGRWYGHWVLLQKCQVPPCQLNTFSSAHGPANGLKFQAAVHKYTLH